MNHSGGVLARGAFRHSRRLHIQEGQKRRRRRGWFGCAASLWGELAPFYTGSTNHDVAYLQQIAAAAQSCRMLSVQFGSSG